LCLFLSTYHVSSYLMWKTVGIFDYSCLLPQCSSSFVYHYRHMSTIPIYCLNNLHILCGTVGILLLFLSTASVIFIFCVALWAYFYYSCLMHQLFSSFLLHGGHISTIPVYCLSYLHLLCGTVGLFLLFLSNASIIFIFCVALYAYVYYSCLLPQLSSSFVWHCGHMSTIPVYCLSYLHLLCGTVGICLLFLSIASVIFIFCVALWAYVYYSCLLPQLSSSSVWRCGHMSTIPVYCLSYLHLLCGTVGICLLFLSTASVILRQALQARVYFSCALYVLFTVFCTLGEF
jgi:hypothetical protein